MFRKAFGSKREDVIEKWRKWIIMSFTICTFYPIFLGVSSQEVGERIILQALEGRDIQIELGEKSETKTLLKRYGCK